MNPRKCVTTSREPDGIVHAADVALNPLCDQTNADKTEQWQGCMGSVNCRRCLKLLAVIDAQRDGDALRLASAAQSRSEEVA